MVEPSIVESDIFDRNIGTQIIFSLQIMLSYWVSLHMLCRLC